jgi:hypothetical protein
MAHLKSMKIFILIQKFILLISQSLSWREEKVLWETVKERK